MAALLCQLDERDDLSMRLEAPPSDRQYANRLMDQYLQCERLDRTERGVAEVLELKLDGNGHSFTLSLPDLSGERLRDQFVDRVWDPHILDGVRRCDGLLLFVHPDLVARPVTIEEGMEVAAAIGDGGAGAADELDGDDDGARFSARRCPTQVQLVDVLQMIADRAPHRPLRVALMVSAWDAVREAEPEQVPVSWLSNRLPLLSQFLEARPDLFSAKVFGVSAQGGRLPERAAELRERPAKERAWIVLADGTEADLAVPLQWALGSDAPEG